jgi:predicted nuclease of restriction endonuclease-like (RecB) superfamily
MIPSDAIDDLHQRVRGILAGARTRAWQAVNAAMVEACWQIGRAIVEEEQRGGPRAEYGRRIVETLSTRLSAEFGAGFSPANLWDMRRFYRLYPILQAAPRELTWTHYRLLLRLDNPEARAFYAAETANTGWSTRELQRQIASLLFERLALSKDRDGVLALARAGQELHRPADLVKDPYVLEFTGIRQDQRLLEADLERALIARLRDFLLELGKGFAFMARQQRITIDGRHFYIDLVFYNRLMHCFVLIDLKVGELTHQDLGQIQMYVNYYHREMTAPDENPPIGIVLCTDKSEAIVRYTLPEGNTQIFASRYKLYLPTEEELASEVQRERHTFELSRRFITDPDTNPVSPED